MESVVDYQELFANGEMLAIKQAASTLSCHECLTAIRTSKRYDLCQTLLPHFKITSETAEEACELYVSALVDGREKELGCWTRDIYIYENTFSFYCGKYAISLASKMLQYHTIDFVSYCQGVVSCDNVELLKILNKQYWHNRIVEYSALVFAPKCMEYFLQSDMRTNLDNCLAGILRNYNRQSMKYLCTYPETKKVVTLKIVYYLQSEEGAIFLRWLLAEKLLQFSDADWETIRTEMPLLYAKLENDV